MKSNQQEVYPIVLFLWVKLSWKTCLLETSEVLGLFVNTLTAEDKYACYKMEKVTQATQCNYLNNEKFFINFLLHF